MRITLSHIITRPEFVLLTDIHCLVETREVGMCCESLSLRVKCPPLPPGCEQALTDILTHMAAHTFPSLPPGCHPHTPLKTLLPANHLRHNGACSTTATSLLTPPYSFHPFAPFLLIYALLHLPPPHMKSVYTSANRALKHRKCCHAHVSLRQGTVGGQ